MSFNAEKLNFTTDVRLPHFNAGTKAFNHVDERLRSTLGVTFSRNVGRVFCPGDVISIADASCGSPLRIRTFPLRHGRLSLPVDTSVKSQQLVFADALVLFSARNDVLFPVVQDTEISLQKPYAALAVLCFVPVLGVTGWLDVELSRDIGVKGITFVFRAGEDQNL